jgi:transaldolase/glucose-6-phosphate isomerase
MSNPLLQLERAGQSVWLDYLHRNIMANGQLKRWIEEDGLKGMTSNPSIFEKAIGEGGDYDAPLQALLERGDLEAADLYERLAIADIQAAADQFRPVYDRLEGADGYVSLEVSPYLAMDTEATISEARRLWRAVDRPNVMIKVPGTPPGAPAIGRLIGEGVNVNVTLLFGLDAYRAVAEAHMAGLEAFQAAGGDLAKVRGVASLFVSRIDTQIDKAIDRRLETAAAAQADGLRALRGKVAIANAKLVYRAYLEMLDTPRWKALAAAGAAPQRLLWASTGAKDPAYSDVLYVESLIGPDTINTMPVKTLDAFRDHGAVRPTLTEGVEAARGVLAAAEALGLELNAVTDRLVVEGVRQFAEAFDRLLATVAEKRAQILGDRLNQQTVSLPAALEAKVADALERARAQAWGRRLWSKDPSLWTGDGEGGWLGWLEAAQGEAVDVGALAAFQSEVKAAGFSHAVLLGMGGSSLGAEVLSQVFGAQPGFPDLVILDSTDPAQIRRVEAQIDIARTLFIVSSKSGSTLEPDLLRRHFLASATRALGEDRAPAHFIAITDAGSALEAAARTASFRRVFHGEAQIGGRYSVLSNFGLVPAAIMGLDVGAFIQAGQAMVKACGPSAPPAANPAIVLGLTLAEAAKAGRDKVCLLLPDPISDLGGWLEQLLAESTGKDGKGLIPVAAEPLGEAGVYGPDRLFVRVRLGGGVEPSLDARVRALADLGHPIVEIVLAGRQTLGQEFFRWEMATAIAGAAIGLNPFDQPDVEASKARTRALTDASERTGGLPPRRPLATSDGLTLFADAANAEVLEQASNTRSLDGYLGAHFRRAHPGDYLGLLAYLDRSADHVAALQEVRGFIRDRTQLATVLGFGPRYLHSTGQAYKGGPNSGVFLQITAAPAEDIPAPGRRCGFGMVEAAQARGDLEVLEARDRRVVRLDLGRDVAGGLKRLAAAVERSLR